MAAIGQTMVVLTGNIDSSPGSIITVVNVVIITLFGKMPGGHRPPAGDSHFSWCAGGMVAKNSKWVLNCQLRLQAVIATFASNLFWMGLALAVLPEPGGVPWDLSPFTAVGFGPAHVSLVSPASHGLQSCWQN